MSFRVGNRGNLLYRKALLTYHSGGWVFYVDVQYFKEWVLVGVWQDDDLVANLDLKSAVTLNMPDDNPLVGPVQDLVDEFLCLQVGTKAKRWFRVEPYLDEIEDDEGV